MSQPCWSRGYGTSRTKGEHASGECDPWARRRTEPRSASYLLAHGGTLGTRKVLIVAPGETTSVVKRQFHAMRHFTCNVRRAECNATIENATAAWNRRNCYNVADAVPDCSALRHACACTLSRRRHASGAAGIAPPRASSWRPLPLCSPWAPPPTDDTQDVHGFPRPSPYRKGSNDVTLSMLQTTTEDYNQQHRCAQQLRKQSRRRCGQGLALPRRRCGRSEPTSIHLSI